MFQRQKNHKEFLSDRNSKSGPFPGLILSFSLNSPGLLKQKVFDNVLSIKTLVESSIKKTKGSKGNFCGGSFDGFRGRSDK